MRSNYFLVILATILGHKLVRSEFKLQILHTNDLHARFCEVDEYTAACSDTDAKANKCFGGFARIRKLADQKKEEARKNNISTIFLNAGDTFQGTPYYTVYKWKIAAELINSLGLDVMVSAKLILLLPTDFLTLLKWLKPSISDPLQLYGFQLLAYFPLILEMF